MHNIGAFSESYRVIVPDLPGFGRTGIPGEPFAPLDYLSFLDGFLRELKIDRAVLCGQSLGGGIALLYAIRCPEKVEKLVLVDCAGLGEEVIWTLRLDDVALDRGAVFGAHSLGCGALLQAGREKSCCRYR